MTLNRHQNSKKSIIWFTSIGFFIICLGILALVGWFLNVGQLYSILPNYATMKFNTAACFIITGASFLLIISYNSIFIKWAYKLMAIVVGVLAAISFSQDVFHWSAGIDQLVVTDYMSTSHGLPYPGRMSPSTSLCFLLVAVSFTTIDAKKILYRKIAQYVLHCVTLISFIAIIGYIFKVPYTLKFSFFSSMAINTSVGFLVLSGAASAINNELGIANLFTGNGIGNIIARKLFPRMVAMLVLLGYISIELQRRNYITAEFGFILSTISFILIGLFLIKNTLNEMNRLDFKRNEAVKETLLLNRNLEQIVLERTLDLQQSNDKFFKIFNLNPAGIAISKLDTGEYVDVNPAMLKILGYKREEMIGHTSQELKVINHSYRKEIVGALSKNGCIKDVDTALNDKQGNIIHAIFSGEIFEDERQHYLMSFIYDITDRKTIETNLEESRNKLQTLTDKLTHQNRQLMGFAHIISHNLRSPVTNLTLLVYLYNESETKEEKDELWANFETVIKHLNVILEELLETLKIQEDTEKAREKLAFEKTLKDIKDILVGQLLESKAVIKCNFSKAAYIVYPKIYLESIMLNLISNAIKYKSPKRVPEITVESDEIDGEIWLTVKDNGLGIDLKRHGNSLFGLRKTFHRHAQAKGLGLFITKTQVEAMGGEIYAESIVDVGTTFKIAFNKKKT